MAKNKYEFFIDVEVANTPHVQRILKLDKTIRFIPRIIGVSWLKPKNFKKYSASKVIHYELSTIQKSNNMDEILDVSYKTLLTIIRDLIKIKNFVPTVDNCVIYSWGTSLENIIFAKKLGFNIIEIFPFSKNVSLSNFRNICNQILPNRNNNYQTQTFKNFIEYNKSNNEKYFKIAKFGEKFGYLASILCTYSLKYAFIKKKNQNFEKFFKDLYEYNKKDIDFVSLVYQKKQKLFLPVFDKVLKNNKL